MSTDFVQYGWDEQAIVVYSLNHEITASFTLTLDSDPESPTNADPGLLLYKNKGGCACPQTSLKSAKTLHMCPVWM